MVIITDDGLGIETDPEYLRLAVDCPEPHAINLKIRLIFLLMAEKSKRRKAHKTQNKLLEI